MNRNIRMFLLFVMLLAVGCQPIQAPATVPPEMEAAEPPGSVFFIGDSFSVVL